MSDEDIIQIVSEAGCGASMILSELGFSEHRINGKSKGQCFVLFKDRTASGITKKHIEAT
jgi:hypothetical protein